MDESRRIIHDVSALAILKVVLVLAAAYALFLVRDTLIVFFVAVILAALIAPLADALEAKRIPRSLTVLAVYVVIVALLMLVLSALVPPILEELRDFLGNFSRSWEFLIGKAGALSVYANQRGFEESVTRSLDTVTSELPQMVLGALGSISGALRGIFSLVLVFVLAFYMVVEGESVKQAVRLVTPERHKRFVIASLVRVQRKLGSWLRAQIILSLTVAVMTYLGLLIVGMPYALVLAILAGLLETVPYAGPVIAAVPAIMLALSISPVKAGLALVVYIIVQQTESHFLIPKITQKFVGLNPIVSIMALLVGAQLAGIAGALVAIPIAASVTMLVEDHFETRRNTADDVQA